MPAYNVEKLCSSLAQGTADPERAQFLCEALEKQQRSRLAHQDVTSGAFKACAEQEKLGSYFSLNTCLNEAARKQGLDNKRQDAQRRRNGKSPVPVYDIGAYCRRAVRAFQGSPALELDCRTREQDALQQILAMEADRKVLAICAKTAESVKGGYVLLRDCLINERKNNSH